MICFTIWQYFERWAEDCQREAVVGWNLMNVFEILTLPRNYGEGGSAWSRWNYPHENDLEIILESRTNSGWSKLKAEKEACLGTSISWLSSRRQHFLVASGFLKFECECHGSYAYVHFSGKRAHNFPSDFQSNLWPIPLHFSKLRRMGWGITSIGYNSGS